MYILNENKKSCSKTAHIVENDKALCYPKNTLQELLACGGVRWKLSETLPEGFYICTRCENIKRLASEPQKPKKPTRREKELQKLARWNGKGD